MRESSVAKRYAKALVKTIKNQPEYLDIKQELETFSHLLKKNKEFKIGMETFLFSKHQKTGLLETINQQGKFKQKTFHFLLTLVEENRLTVLEEIIRLLEALWFEANGIEKLKVHSAVALNETLEKKLIKSLEKAFDKKIVIEKEIDPALIAGIKVQRGAIFYDFSLQGNLKKLKEALLTDIETSAASPGEH